MGKAGNWRGLISFGREARDLDRDWREHWKRFYMARTVAAGDSEPKNIRPAEKMAAGLGETGQEATRAIGRDETRKAAEKPDAGYEPGASEETGAGKGEPGCGGKREAGDGETGAGDERSEAGGKSEDKDCGDEELLKLLDDWARDNGYIGCAIISVGFDPSFMRTGQATIRAGSNGSVNLYALAQGFALGIKRFAELLPEEEEEASISLAARTLNAFCRDKSGTERPASEDGARSEETEQGRRDRGRDEK